MGTHAVGAACQLAWEPKICIFRTSRPCLSYLSGAGETWTVKCLGQVEDQVPWLTVSQLTAT